MVLARTQGPKLERMGLHRWELYYKIQTKKMDLSLLELEPTTLIQNKITTVNPGGTSIRAKLAGIAAALINGHIHIATDSAGALWQIGNSVLYPQRMKRHIHAKLLGNE
jgi:hypothetical protein